MTIRYFLLLGTASLFLSIGNAMTGDSAPSTHDPTPAIAQLPPCPPPPPPLNTLAPGSDPEPPWAQALQLSSEQQQQIRNIHKQGIQNIQKLQQQLFAADRQLRSLFKRGAVIAQLRQQHQYIQTLRQQLDNNHFEMMLAERQVLTPDQRLQLDEGMPQPW